MINLSYITFFLIIRCVCTKKTEHVLHIMLVIYSFYTIFNLICSNIIRKITNYNTIVAINVKIKQLSIESCNNWLNLRINLKCDAIFSSNIL